MAALTVCRGCGRRDTRDRSGYCGLCLRGGTPRKDPRPKFTDAHEAVEDDYGEESDPDSIVLDSEEARAQRRNE